MGKKKTPAKPAVAAAKVTSPDPEPAAVASPKAEEEIAELTIPEPESAASAAQAAVPTEGDVTSPASGEGGAASPVEESADAGKELVVAAAEGEGENPAANPGEGLYAMSVTAPNGQLVELQVSPSDTVIDIRQFLSDALETCYYTCSTLEVVAADGTRIPLTNEFIELGEVVDVAAGCRMEMKDGVYDERSTRLHLRRLRELLSMEHCHASLSTSLHIENPPEDAPRPGESEQAAEQRKKEEAEAEVKARQPVEIPELSNLDYLKDSTSVLEAGAMRPPPHGPACISSLAFSAWNPPPGHRRLVGDLMYLEARTLEDKSFCITCHTRGFYINKSTPEVFNAEPRASGEDHASSTLVGLLRSASPKFAAGFTAVLDKKATGHPFEHIPLSMAPRPWLAPHPPPPHRRDVGRSEDVLHAPHVLDTSGTFRDWNEEYQSCKELPKETLQDRIMRDRALFKVNCDFVEAAERGAHAIIGRCIPPINPTDPERFHMYVHNGIFFSFAMDATPSNLSAIKEFTESQRAAAAAQCTCADKAHAHGHSHDAEDSKGGENGSDNAGAAVPAAPPAPVAEQATYASANNDLKGTRSFNRADVAGLHALTMAIIDYRGHRVVAQSIIPGILYGDKTSSLLYGSVDSGKRIAWNEAFHAKMSAAGSLLHIKEHRVVDGEGKEVLICAPVECKGIVGSDDRHYILDLIRTTPRDVNFEGPEHRMAILRPELVQAFCAMKAKEKAAKEAAGGEDATAREGGDAAAAKEEGKAVEDASSGAVASPKAAEGSPAGSPSKGSNKKDKKKGAKSGLGDAAASPAKEVTPAAEAAATPATPEVKPTIATPVQDPGVIALNPNVFCSFKLSGSEESIKADEALVREACAYLSNDVLDKLVKDLYAMEVSPMDSATLTEAMHGAGVNMRYLGQLARKTEHLPHVRAMCVHEMVLRAAKHEFKAVLRFTPDDQLAAVIAHFLNCFVGNVAAEPAAKPVAAVAAAPASTESPRKGGKNKKDKGGKKDAAAKPATPSPAATPDAAVSSTGSSAATPLLGLTLTADDLWASIAAGVKQRFQFDLAEGARGSVRKLTVLRGLCLKVGVVLAARAYDLDAAPAFLPSDVRDLRGLVKHTRPLCADAKDILEAGKAQLGEGRLNEAYELFSEAFAVLQQVCGPLHAEVAHCCRYLAMVQYHAGDLEQALIQQQRELVINERVLGVDHPDTAHSYGNMALFYHGLGQHGRAFAHMHHAMRLLSLLAGPSHPDCASTFINIAMMFQDVDRVEVALRYLQEALECHVKLLGKDHIQTAVCYHALAIAFHHMQAYKLSVQHESNCHAVLQEKLGDDDPRTKDAALWLKQFNVKLAQQAAAKQRATQQGQIAQPTLAQVAAVAKQLQQQNPKQVGVGMLGTSGGTRANPALAQAIAHAVQQEQAAQGLGAGLPMNAAARRRLEQRKKEGAAKAAGAAGAAAQASDAAKPVDELVKFINQKEGRGGKGGEGKPLSPDVTPTPAPTPTNAPAPQGLGGMGLPNGKKKRNAK